MMLPESLTYLTNADLNDLSENALVMVIPISKSKNFPLVESYAGMMKSAKCIVNGREVITCLADLSSPRDCDLSMTIINAAHNWKGFEVIAKRKIVSSFSYYQVIPCIIEAMQCKNKNAHCHTRVNNASFLRTYALQPLTLLEQQDLEVILPCKLASYGFFDPKIDASLEDQYQALAVSRGVHWCPNFDASLIKVFDNKNSEKSISDCGIEIVIQNKKPSE
ncbi:hypothetical protein SAMN05216516_10527 [Izhakiella capsodis]|uniref:Uncharacterized protein n=1 Tax=Izhakiella capsodis TaxID=1367852 RepID=A0A1I4XWN8_9GAMM|nr:hypothetical protein [Izhakiella capsodis]SFN29793.1 hypothetical protein SAMN05216516_10527 [Izhakiella capsodis]